MGDFLEVFKKTLEEGRTGSLENASASGYSVSEKNNLPANAKKQPRGTFLDVFAAALEEDKARKLQAETAANAQKNLAGRSEFTRGLLRGIDTLQATYEGGIGMYNAAMGNQEAADRRFANYQEQMRQASENPATVTDFFSTDKKTGAFASPSNFGTYVAGTLGQAVPSLTEAVASGIAGAAIGAAIVPAPDPTDVVTIPAGAIGGFLGRNAMKRAIASAAQQYAARGMAQDVAEQTAERYVRQAVANRIASNVGSGLAVSQTTAFHEGGGMYAEGLEQGYNAPGSAMALGQVSGFSEALFGAAPSAVRAIIGKTALNETAKEFGWKTAAGYAWDILKNAGEEGVQEGFQEFLGSVNQGINDPKFKLNSKENFMQWAEAAAAGAVTGGVVGVGGSGLQAIRDRKRQLEEIRNKKFVSESDAQEAGIAGESRRERMDNLNAEMEDLDQQEADAMQQSDQEFINQQQQAGQIPPSQPSEYVEEPMSDDQATELDRQFAMLEEQKRQQAGGNVAPPTQEQTPASFAERVARGDKVTSPEDQQFYKNNAAEIESELQKLAGQRSVPPSGIVSPPAVPTPQPSVSQGIPPQTQPESQPQVPTVTQQPQLTTEQQDESDRQFADQKAAEQAQQSGVTIDSIRQAASGQPIGRGGNAFVYGISDDLVLRVPKNITDISDDFYPVDNPFTKYGIRVGQPVFENSQGVGVLQRQKGEEAGLALPRLVPEDQRDAVYSSRVKKAAAMPQSAYDDLASTMLDINDELYGIDPSKSSNLLIDSDGKRFNFVDVQEVEEEIAVKQRKSAASYLLTMLMGNTYARNYKGEPLTEDYKQIYDKVMSAARASGLGTEMTPSGKYSMSLAGIEEIDLDQPGPPKIGRKPVVEKPTEEINGRTIQQMRDEGMSEDQIQEEESKQNYYNVIEDVTKASDKDLNRAYGFSGRLVDYFDRNGQADMAESVRRERESMKAEIVRRNALNERPSSEQAPPSDVVSPESDIDAAMEEEFRRQLAQKDKDQQPPPSESKPPKKRSVRKKKPSTEKPPRASRSKEERKKEIDDLWNQLINESKNRLPSGLDPELLKIAAKLAIAVIEDGALTFAEFVKASVVNIPGDMLDRLKPYIESAWRTAHRNKMTEDAGGKFDDYMEKPQEQPKQEQPESRKIEPKEQPEAEKESDVDKTLRQAGLKVEQLADGTWQITGNTYEHSKEIGDVKREIRELGGYWDKYGKRWTFKADPRRAISDRLVSKGVGAEPADDGVSAEQMARERARRAEDEKPDIQTTSETYVASVDQSTRDLISRGLKFGMTEEVVNNQIEDIGRVINAVENGRPMFVIGSAPGTGKTFVLGGVVKELRSRGFEKFVYVTQNQDLVSQVQNNLADYGLEGVEFATYAKAREVPPNTSGAVLLLDEAHSAKNLDRETGKKLARMVQSSDFTVYATATPFENVSEAEYIGYSGIFDDLRVEFTRPSTKPGGRPFRNELFGFKAWAWMFGANVFFVKQEDKKGNTFYVPVVWWDKHQTSEEDQLAANEWLKKRGVFVQRPMALPEGTVVSELRSIDADPYWADISNQVVEIYANAESQAENNVEAGQIKAHKANVLKRLLEAAKVDAAIARAKELIGEGRKDDSQVIIFVNSKADTDIGTYTLSEPYRKEHNIKGKEAKRRYTPSEMDEAMQRWYQAREAAEAMGEGRASVGPPPFAPFVHKIAMAMNNAGVMKKFPSVIDRIMDEFPGQAVEYSGRTASQNSSNLAKWKNNEAKLIVATMDKGGTGLSFHDTTGTMPSRYQVNMNLPWSGTKVEQVSGRLARYGTAKPVTLEWLFASNIPFDRELSKTVGSRMRSMSAAVQGRKSGDAKRIREFDFEQPEMPSDTVSPVSPWVGATVDDESRWAGTSVNVSAKGREEAYTGTVVRVLNEGETIEVQRDGFDAAIRVPAERVNIVNLVDSKPESEKLQDEVDALISKMESNQEKMREDKKRREGEKLANWLKAFEGSPREVTAAKDLFRKDFEKARENGVSDDRLIEIIEHGQANEMFTEQEAADLKNRIKPARQMHYPDGSAYREWTSRRHRLGDKPTSYLSGHSSAKVREAAKQNPGLGLVITPANPSYVGHAGDYSHLMIDNGAFSEFTGNAPFSEDKFFALLDSVVATGLKNKVQFVVVPDRVGDWEGTNERWKEFHDRVKAYGMPLAYVGQDGIEDHMDTIPWDEFDVFFIGGSTPWKLGYDPKGDYKDINRPTDDELRKAGVLRNHLDLIKEARRRGKRIHMGRVNSWKRMEIANYGMQVDSADGNYIGAAPDKNLPVVLDWLKDTGGESFKQRHQLLLDRAAKYREKGDSYNRNIADPAMRLNMAIANGNPIDGTLVQSLIDELEIRLDHWEPILRKAKEENEARDQEDEERPQVDGGPKEGDGLPAEDKEISRRIVGNKTKVGKRKAHYEVVELRSLIGSHHPFGMAVNEEFPEEWQKYQRTYHTYSDEEKREVWMPRNGFDPSQLIDTTRWHDRGPTMVVEKDGRLYVVGGTRRYMMLANQYRSFEDKAMDYLNALVAEADLFGLDAAAVNGMDNPILIRVIDEPGSDIPKLVDELNADAGFEKDPAAEAASLGRSIGKETIAILRGINDDETLAKFLDRKGVDVVYAMVSDNPELKIKVPSWIKDKSLTKDAKLAIQKAIMGAVIPDATLISQASPRMLQSINGALSEILSLNQKGGEWSLSERIMDAITYDAAFRVRGESASDRNINYWMNDPQMTFFEGFKKDPNSDGYRLWRYLLEFGGARKFRNALQSTMIKEAGLEVESGGLFAGLDDDFEESTSGNEAFDMLLKSGKPDGTNLLMQLDREITNPPDSLFQSEPDVDADIGTKALALGMAAQDAGITQFEDFIVYSVEKNGEKLTRYMGAYLKRVGELVGMKGVRPVKDILGVPMTPEQYVEVAKQAFAGSPQVTAEQVETGVQVAMLTGLPQMAAGFSPAGTPVPTRGMAAADQETLMQQRTKTDTPAFKNWFGDSKVVDEDGKPLVVYHGTQRPDRVGNRFRKSRATSGPMAFFTDSPELGSSYATRKRDTSLERPDDYAGWFQWKGKGMRSPVNIDRAWFYLSKENKDEITKKIYTVGYSDADQATGPIVADSTGIMSRGSVDYELRQARGNALRALVEMWLSSGTLFNDEQVFLDVLKAVGLSNVSMNDPDASYPAVYPVFLSIKNPLSTSRIPDEVLLALDSASKRKRAKKAAGGDPDLWDKNTISGKDWMERLRFDIKNETTHAWTSIPDWVTDTLSGMGYDGIEDTGGKHGGTPHGVWIPFNELQIKSAIANVGTYDPTNPNMLMQEGVGKTKVGKIKITPWRWGYKLERKVGKGKVTFWADVQDFYSDENYTISADWEAEEDTPKGTGAATDMMLELLQLAKNKRVKGVPVSYISDSIRSENADRLYERLIAAGVPFSHNDDYQYVLSADQIASLDIEKIRSNLAAKYTTPSGDTNPNMLMQQGQGDAAYLAAVERGDMEAAQRMVDEAAKEAGEYAGGVSPVVYHGSPHADFYEFQIPSKGFNSTVFGSYEVSRNAAFFTPDKGVALDYQTQGGRKSGSTRSFRVFGEMLDLRDGIRDAVFNALTDKGVNARWLERKGASWELFDREEDPDGTLVKSLMDMGYDGVVIKDTDGKSDFDAYVAFSPSQIKSSDPVTRDDAGNVIPLSQRFNDQQSDIRFQQQGQGGNVKGWTKFITGTRALIGATSKADISTVIHEYAHVIRRFLLNKDVPQDQRLDITDAEIEMLEQKCGVKNGNWDVEAEEKFARMWEQYFYEGKSPNTLLESLFAKISRWMQSVYQTAMEITGRELDPEVRKLFDKMIQRGLPADQRSDTASRGGKKPPRGLPPRMDQVGDNLTSAANAINLEWRELYELGGFDEVLREEFPMWIESAVAILRADPTRAVRLVKELAANTRNIDKTETAILNLHYRVLVNQSNATAERLFTAIDQKQDDVTIVQLRRESDLLINEIEELSTVLNKVGTEQGRSLAARKMILRSDFTLDGLRRLARIANGGEKLSEEQQRQIEEMAGKIAKLEGDLAKARQEADDLARQLAIKESMADAVKQAGTPVRSTARNKAASAAKSFVSKFAGIFGKKDDTTTLQQSEDEQMADDAVELIKGYVSSGVYSFGEFMAKFKQDIGSDVPLQARVAIRKSWDRMKAEGDIPTPDFPDEQENRELRRLAKMIQRNLVESGITDREEVIDGVYESLQEVFEDVTRREAMDAMSGYGIFTELSDDANAAIIRDLNGQYLQMAKLDDMRQGIAPRKTGGERRVMSPDERELIQQVNQMKRESKYFITDPERQLRSIFQATRTALKNRIYDLDRAINKTKKPIPGREPQVFEGEQAKEIAELRRQRDELMAEYKKTFPKPGLTFEQRAAIAERSADRAIAEIERQLATGDIAPKARGAGITTPELEAKRKRLDALRAEREAAREAQKPKLTEEELAEREERRAEKAYIANLLSRIADYEDRRVHGYFEGRPKKEPRKLSEEEKRLSRELENIKDEFFRLAAEYRLAKMGKVERAWDYLKETMHLSRAIMTSFDLSAVFRQGGIASLAHPRLALASSREMGKALLNGAKEFDTLEKIRSDKLYALAMTAGLSVTTESGKITKQEEAYMGRWAKWGVGRKGSAINKMSRYALFFVAPSARSYTTFLNSMRFQVFKYMVSNLGTGGEVTVDEAKVIAAYVNAATGRAELGKFNQAAANLNMVFFAPRYVASRFQYLAMPFYLLPSTKVSGRVKKMIAMEYARHAMGLTAFFGLSVVLASMLTDDEEEKPTVEFDPRSSDFMKLKIGDTRIDPMAGLSQTVTLIGQLTTGQKKGLRGDIQDLYGEKKKFGDPDLWDVTTGFLRKKLAPIPGAIVDLRVGENVIGEKETPLSVTTDLFVPLAFQEAIETMNARGLVGGAAVTALSLLGMGGGTYGPKTEFATANATKREELFKKDIERMKWDSPDPAYKDFLTTDQVQKWEKRRDQRKESLAFSGSADPKRKDYNSDENYKEAIAERDKALDAMIKAGMTAKEVQALLIAYYKRNFGSAYEVRGGVYQMKESLANRLRVVRRKLSQQTTSAK